MSQKLELAERATAPGANVSDLCRELGISRQAGHKWIRRYRDQGDPWLVEKSRRPASSPLATGEEIVASILAARAPPELGHSEDAQVLKRRLGDGAPSRSTVARALFRLGKVKRRRPASADLVGGRPAACGGEGPEPWMIDFKGWWRVLNGEKCEPLTVRDAFSRKVLAVNLFTSTRTTEVRRVLEHLYWAHGWSPSAFAWCVRGPAALRTTASTSACTEI